MANLSIPLEERNMTPQQIEMLDLRRRKGTLLLFEVCGKVSKTRTHRHSLLIRTL